MIGQQYFWVRDWTPYGGWSDYYQGWDAAIAHDFRAHTQAGAFVIADIFDVDQNHWLPRETWQSYSPGGGGGRPRTETPWDAGGGAPPPADLPPGLVWTALPAGTDVTLKKNYYYDALASVKTSHDLPAIRAMLVSKGMKILTLDEQPPQAGYRIVHVVALATADAGTVPWKVPWFVPGDSSSLVSAKTAPAVKGLPARPPSGSETGPIVAGLLVAGLVGATGWALWRRHQGKPILPKLSA